MTERSYFGKMNSTLGSVVPLAMLVCQFPLVNQLLLYSDHQTPREQKQRDKNGEELYEKQNCSTENKAKEGGYEEEIGKFLGHKNLLDFGEEMEAPLI